MTTRGWSLWGLAKLTLLALVIAAGAIGLTRDHHPAHASHTKLYLTRESSCDPLQELTSFVTFVNGPTEPLFLCVKDLDNSPWGAAALNLNFTYVSWLINVTAVLIDHPSYASGWLDDTGRAVQCLPVTIAPNLSTGQGLVTGDCHTAGTNPPYGPMSNHLLAGITISPGITKGMTFVDFRGTVGQPNSGTLLISPIVADAPDIIPASVPLLPVNIAPCADYQPIATGGNDFVNIFDILYLAGKFSQSSSSPGWNPDWDMDGNNFVNVFDVLIAARQFGRTCPA